MLVASQAVQICHSRAYRPIFGDQQANDRSLVVVPYQGGISGMLPKTGGNRKSKIFTPGLHQALKSRMSDSRTPLSGYRDARSWIRDNYGIQVNYHWLRKYLTEHFRTKLKIPRKSHIRKEGEAEKAFLKTARYHWSY